MKVHLVAAGFLLGVALAGHAQQEEPEQASKALPEEVLITGDRSLVQLRREMLAAEKNAYDIFNQFNDEKRFRISCSTQEPTGSRIQSATQLCQPNFEREANRLHGQDYLESYRAFMAPDSFSVDKNVAPVNPPSEMMIAAQQRAYKEKLKQVAEEHPEFLEALIDYSEIQAQYRNAAGLEKE